MRNKLTSNNNLPYVELLAGTPEHRQFISHALITGNLSHLEALKKRTGKSIHLVHNWFHYGLMKLGHTEEAVVIYTPEDELKMKTIFNQHDQ